jgi:hypothetical protein
MSSTSTETGRDEGVVDQVTTKVSDAASTAQEKAGELTTKGKSRLAEQLDDRTTTVGSQARSVAQSLRQSTEQLRNEGNTGAANVAEQAATHIERIGSYLEQKGGNDILRDVESFARRRPWMIAGISVLGGIAAARFLKASSERRYDRYDGRRRLPSGEYPPVTGGGYAGTSAYVPGYEPGGRGFDDGTAPLTRDPGVADPLVDRPLGPEG